MTTDLPMHEPTPDFRDHLEREVLRTFRREGRQLEQRRRLTTRRLRAAAVVIVSIAIGASAGMAPAQIRDGARRDSLLQSANAEAQLAMLRLQLARENVADVRRKLEVGALGPESLASAETELRAMEARTMRARFDIEEIAATARPPRDDLNAPLVNGRDFVKDRLQLEAMAAQQRMTAAEAAQVEAERRARVGAGSELAVLEASGEVARARGALAVVAKRLELRREFLEHGTAVEELQRRLDETTLRADAMGAQRGLELARARLTTLERQRQAGAVGELEVMRAQVEVKERELELHRIAQQLRGRGAP